MNKIVSNFYLIKVEGEPSYVGYTNRPVKTRLGEHLRDKDFGDDLVELESLGSLEYDFTWDENLINSYAKEVSDRETELILEYDTKDTIWQKGTSGNLGGQTWANVKYFIRTNRDNPKFRGLPEEAILAYLETSDRVSRYMKNFVHDMDDPVAIYMKHFVSNMGDPVAIYLKNFVGGMADPVSRYMKDFVKTMDDPVASYIKNFVHHMDDPVAIYMKHFVSNMGDPVAIYMKNFVSTMDDPVASYMKNFVHDMDDPVAIYMKNFVSNMDDPVAIYMKNFVGNMKNPIDN